MWEWGRRGRPIRIGEHHYETDAHKVTEILANIIGKERAKPWIPLDPTSVFNSFRSKLEEIHHEAKSQGDATAETQQTLWKELIRGSGLPVPKGEEGRLYRAHIMLLAVSRAVASLLRGQNKSIEKLLQDSFAAWVGQRETGKAWLRDIKD